MLRVDYHFKKGVRRNKAQIMQFIAHDGIRHKSEFYGYGNKQSGCKTDELSQRLSSSRENPLDEVCQKSRFCAR
jgi:hypothetical protein